MALIWAQFTERDSYLQNYQQLKQHADRSGAWPQWRERALLSVLGFPAYYLPLYHSPHLFPALHLHLPLLAAAKSPSPPALSSSPTGLRQ